MTPWGMLLLHLMNTPLESSPCSSNSREADTREGRRLEYLSLGWTVIEAGVALLAGVLAGSIALVGFGADSVIEGLSSAVLLWRLQSHGEEHRETLALRLVGCCFLLLAA